MKDAGEQTRMQMLVSLFLWKGPFGLGGLWQSDAFEHGEKIALTVAVLVYTAILVVVVYLAGAALYRRMALP